jgi:serine/threonine protein kinase
VTRGVKRPRATGGSRVHSGSEALLSAGRLDIAIEIARGLTYLHRRGEEGEATGPIFHRDLKVRTVGAVATALWVGLGSHDTTNPTCLAAPFRATVTDCRHLCRAPTWG